MTARSPRVGAQPATASDFIGRERELEKIATLLLGSTRLITLIGAGGIGKTRLATEAVHRYHKAKRVSVHWVRLARLPRGADAAAVENELAQSLVSDDFSGRPAWDALADTLTRTDAVGRTVQTILVVDNCEHVLEGAGRVIADLIGAIPGLTVVATSREAIGWVDEYLVPVGSLSGEQALTMFQKRAELTGHSVSGTADHDLATAICRRVHNHPLAIQLAAARLRRQPLSMILRDLTGEASDRRLGWSPGHRVGADGRHQGIRDVIAWSYDLCHDKERLLFERLSVFAAGYDPDPGDADACDIGADLEAIEAVCCDEAADVGADGIARDEVEGLLDRLVDQSIVSVHLTKDTVRYSLLESFRVFAQQRLRERAGGEETARFSDRHRRYYRDKVARAGIEWLGPDEQVLLEWARAAWDNLLCAIDSAEATPGEATVGLDIMVGLIALRVPFFKGSLRESRHLAERALAATRDLDPQPVELQVTAMAMIGWISLCQGIPADAERLLDDCVAACVTDPGAVARARREPEVDLGLPAPVEFTRGSQLMLTHNDSRAIEVLARARRKFLAAGDRGAASMTEMFEVLATGFVGTPAQALESARRHLDDAGRSGARWEQSWAELSWSLALIKNSDTETALATVRTTLANQLAMRDQWGAVWAVHMYAWALARKIADACGQPPGRDGLPREWALEVAWILGGAGTLRRRLGVDLTNLAPFRAETERAAQISRSVLGEAGFTAAEQEGAMLRPELGEVAALALGTLSLDALPVHHPVRRHRPTRWQELSAAEQDVATLAAAGWTNTAIAARRGSSFKTVDAQMAAIFQKLTITSRDDIIALVPAERRAQVAQEVARRPNKPRKREPRPPAP
ncbi:LuxR family transcriptional regulator [Nocardia cyriacigeorgica]|uniref:LuxR family transcriptional regulator n=1 Tax=Nocardia cyriacigeorgica TaxID=135487 RepID=A0A6P1D9H4_9NOCA|nr:AAA family ATPase [Nocardia cyriacigeorgica]NEW41543.1 LuxR family transcriptional regulator [Nocardia cyriacigeorgica]NEW46758.1 LuxR family transcriptional regulator [Nocardia cyriacigeorgica]NEW52055.1 LuxR family transcriptional regulator [Nocardia cyriacigeorgica]NEW55848.1 LuxR family transcriptional regulator [Nocardia cyriacigeorgica]